MNTVQKSSKMDFFQSLQKKLNNFFEGWIDKQKLFGHDHYRPLFSPFNFANM